MHWAFHLFGQELIFAQNHSSQLHHQYSLISHHSQHLQLRAMTESLFANNHSLAFVIFLQDRNSRPTLYQTSKSQFAPALILFRHKTHHLLRMLQPCGAYLDSLHIWDSCHKSQLPYQIVTACIFWQSRDLKTQELAFADLGQSTDG